MVRQGGILMRKVKANGIEIAYGTFGEREGRPLLLVMGLSRQMVAWPEAFCKRLAEIGHFVVRFDNRDVGLSSKMEDAGFPDLTGVMMDYQAGRILNAPYTLSDMAADAIGLMDAIRLEKAHVCGLSMGGMIAQTMAMEYPDRLLSLISMQSTTGEPGLPAASPQVMEVLFSPPPSEREAYIQHMIRVFRTFGGGSDKFHEGTEREISGISYDRSFYPVAFARQLTAVLADGSRRRALTALTVPTLVIHGTNDALVPLEHGMDTAKAIPGAKLAVIEGMGHGMSYPELWGEIVEAIASHTASVIRVQGESECREP
jgi:pimeloyl-ACP methyl ester carboxylesterase